MNQFRNYGFGGMKLFTPMIKYLIIINFSIFAIQIFFGNFKIGDATVLNYIVYYFALLPFDMESPLRTIWQIFTHQFLHGDFLHIFFNMFMLWMFGREIENRWGPVKFITFYLLSGIGGGIFVLISNAITPSLPTLGASGAIMGIMIAYGMSFPDRSVLMFPFFIPIKAKYLVMIMIAINIFMGLDRTSYGVSWEGHLGGFFAGYLLFKFGDQLGIFRFFEGFFKNAGGSSPGSFQSKSTSSSGFANVYQATSWTQERQTPPQEAASAQGKKVTGWYMNGEEITQARIDEILDKITKSGYENLTEEEKKILFELSQKLK